MFFYENINMNTNLVYRLEENDKLDHTTIGMLSNNKISNICSAKCSQLDNDIIVKFDVTSKVPASQIFSRVLNRKWVMGLLESICGAILDAQKYMLDLRQIVLDLNYIFIDVSTGKMDFICLPLQNVTDNDFLGFIKNIVFGATFTQNEDNRYVSAIISYVNSENTFSVNSLKNLIDSINQNHFVNAPQVAQQQNMQVVQQNIPQVSQNNIQQTNYQNVQQNVPKQYNQTQSQKTQVQSVQPQNVRPHNNPVAQQPLQPISQRQQQYPPASQKNTKNNRNNISVPPINKQQIPSPMPVELQGDQISEKKMSLFYLMCHYNKENSAKYKAQKNAAKDNVINQTNSFDYDNRGQTIPQNNSRTNTKQKKNYIGNIPPVQQPVQPVQNNIPSVQQPVQPVQNNISSVQQPVQPVQNNIPPVQQPVQPVQNNIPPVQQSQPIQNASEANIYSQNYSTVTADYGETTVLGGDDTYGETTVLGEENYQNKITPYLVRVKNNEKININKPMFRIGKEKSYVDYFIGDNNFISRGHANIICRDDRCYIVDNNSRNHTYVNGQMITSGDEVELKNGDTIKLANEAFEFKVF